MPQHRQGVSGTQSSPHGTRAAGLARHWRGRKSYRRQTSCPGVTPAIPNCDLQPLVQRNGLPKMKQYLTTNPSAAELIHRDAGFRARRELRNPAADFVGEFHDLLDCTDDSWGGRSDIRDPAAQRTDRAAKVGLVATGFGGFHHFLCALGGLIG